MLKSLCFALLISVVVACNSNTDTTNTQPVKADSIPDTSSTALTSADAALADRSKEILTVLEEKNLVTFAGFIHPTEGVRFSPYGFVDTTKDVRLSRDQFLSHLSKKTKLTWGSYDGSGEPITMTIEEYFRKFVYDAKFLEPESHNLNKTVATGSSVNNQATIYPGAVYTESYFSGFDPKYNGMDWRSLRLVFKKHNDELFLVAVIHEQWTI
jgi:hypothetical protein